MAPERRQYEVGETLGYQSCNLGPGFENGHSSDSGLVFLGMATDLTQEESSGRFLLVY